MAEAASETATKLEGEATRPAQRSQCGTAVKGLQLDRDRAELSEENMVEEEERERDEIVVVELSTEEGDQLRELSQEMERLLDISVRCTC